MGGVDGERSADDGEDGAEVGSTTVRRWEWWKGGMVVMGFDELGVIRMRRLAEAKYNPNTTLWLTHSRGHLDASGVVVLAGTDFSVLSVPSFLFSLFPMSQFSASL